MKKAAYRIPENWIARFLEPRYPDLVEPYREAGGITVRALRDGHLDDADLDTLIGYVRHPASVLAGAAGDMLGILAGVFPSALRAVEVLGSDSRAAVREQAIGALLRSEPTPVHERVYAAALGDRSKNLRAYAAQSIQSQRVEALLPALDAAAGRERDAATKTLLTEQAALLRDGYVVRRSADRVSVTVATAAGTVSRSFDPADFDTAGRAWIAARMET